MKKVNLVSVLLLGILWIPLEAYTKLKDPGNDWREGVSSRTHLFTHTPDRLRSSFAPQRLEHDPFYNGFDDFRFSRRLRRFYPVRTVPVGFGYYDPFFTNDIYYMINTPIWNRFYAPRRVFFDDGFYGCTSSYFVGYGVGNVFFNAGFNIGNVFFNVGFGRRRFFPYRFYDPFFYNPFPARVFVSSPGFFSPFGIRRGFNRGFSRGYNYGYANGYNDGFVDGYYAGGYYNNTRSSNRWYRQQRVDSRSVAYRYSTSQRPVRYNNNSSSRRVNGQTSSRRVNGSGNQPRYVVPQYEAPSRRASANSRNNSSNRSNSVRSATSSRSTVNSARNSNGNSSVRRSSTSSSRRYSSPSNNEANSSSVRSNRNSSSSRNSSSRTYSNSSNRSNSNSNIRRNNSSSSSRSYSSPSNRSSSSSNIRRK